MITKEQFDAVYNKHLPNAYVTFIYKYFSAGTTKSDMTPSKIVSGLLIGLFMIGYIPSLLGIETPLIGIATIAYSIGLAIFVIGVFIAILLNKSRLKKIYTELGISRDEYNTLVLKYYPES